MVKSSYPLAKGYLWMMWNVNNYTNVMQQLSLFTFRQIYTIRFFFCSHNSTGIDRQIFYLNVQLSHSKDNCVGVHRFILSPGTGKNAHTLRSYYFPYSFFIFFPISLPHYPRYPSLFAVAFHVRPLWLPLDIVWLSFNWI